MEKLFIIPELFLQFVCFCQVRQEELEELDGHIRESCELPVAGGSENHYGKVNILLQTYISREMVNAFSLVSDQAYIAQVKFYVYT